MKTKPGQVHVFYVDRGVQSDQAHSESLLVTRLDSGLAAFFEVSLQPLVPECLDHIWIVAYCALRNIDEADVVQALQWLEAAGSGGNLTTDAQIAAIAHRHRATVHTADTDFNRFKDIRWKNPILNRD